MSVHESISSRVSELPGRDYNEAYAQLERALRDSNLPENAQDLFGSSVLQPIRAHSVRKVAPPKSDARYNTAQYAPQSFRNRVEPRMTRSSHQSTPSYGRSTNQSKDRYASNGHDIQTTDFATYLNYEQGHPLSTSDVVDPGGQPFVVPGKEARASPFSVAGSFATAREDQSVINGDSSNVQLPLDGINDEYMSYNHRQTDYAGLKNMGWGIDGPALEQDMSSNSLAPVQLQPSDLPFFEAFEKEWNEGRFRNVTVRKNRGLESEPYPGRTFLDDRKSDEPAVLADTSRPETPSPESSWLDTASLERRGSADFAVSSNRSSISSSPIHPTKRTKRGSEGSTTVEATVLDSSPQSNHTLRHKIKAEGLRNRVEPTNGLGLDFNNPAQISGDELGQSQSQTPGLTYSSIEMSDLSSMPSDTQLRGLVSYEKPRPTKSMVSRLPSHLTAATNSTHLPLRSKTVNHGRETDMQTYHHGTKRSATDAGSKNKKARLTPILSFPSHEIHAREDLPREPSPTDKIGTPLAVQQYTAEYLAPRDSFRHSRSHSSPEGRNSRWSFIGSEGLARVSMDSSHPVVSQATAISIHPHNNNSLLLVQQHGSSDSSQIDISEYLVPEAPGTPTQTSYLQGQRADDLSNSEHTSRFTDIALENPRKPPDPPPANAETFPEEIPFLKTQKTEVVHVDPPPQGRRGTVIRLARRWSDTIANPVRSLVRPHRDQPLKHEFRGPPSEISTPIAVDGPSHEGRNLFPLRLSQGLTSGAAGNPLDTSEPQAAAMEAANESAVIDDSLQDPVDTDHPSLSVDREAKSAQGPTSLAPPTSGKLKFPPSTAANNSLRRGGTLRNFFRRNPSPAHSGYYQPSVDSTSADGSEYEIRPGSAQESTRRSRSTERRPSLTRSLSEVIRSRWTERNAKRQERAESERREKVRNSIGPRFFVETDASGYGAGLPEQNQRNEENEYSRSGPTESPAGGTLDSINPARYSMVSDVDTDKYSA